MRYPCALIAITLAVGGIGCGDSPPTSVTPQDAPLLVILSGDGQTSEVGTITPEPLTVKLFAGPGRPAVGRFVVFRGADARTDSARTDGEGVAAVRWLLATYVGTYQIDASATMGPSSAPLPPTVSWHVKAVAGPPNAIERIGRDSVAVAPGTQLDLTARVADRYGNPVGGATVQWSVSAGGGSVEALAATTDSGGGANARWAIGTIGGVSRAMVVAGADLTAHFTATVTSLFAAASVSVADDHSCALDTMGAAYCWGANDAGQLGTGRFDAVPRTNPVKVSTGNTFVSLAAGHKYTCGLTDTGKAFCWGMNDVAQLGSAVAGVSTPVPVSVAGGHAFTALAAGRRHACGLTTDGVAFCWGDGSFGLTGNAVPGIRTIPIRVPIARRLTALSAGSDFTCALSDGGDVFCWGRDDQRQLGSVSTETCVLGDTEDDFGETVTVTGQCSYTPVRVATSHTVVSLVSAPAESCGVTADALLVCWGNGFIAPRVTEGIPLDGTVVLGMGVVCGLDGGGALRCRDFAQGAAALVLGNALSFKRLTGSASHFCGVVRGDPSIAYCWGVNEFGQLGDGTTQRRGLPVPVASPVPGVRE